MSRIRRALADAVARGVPRTTLQFFGLTYLFTWAFWLPMLLAPDRLQFLHYLGSLGPLAAAFVMRYRTGGRPAVCELIGQMGVPAS